jgi:hypothetical protein
VLTDEYRPRRTWDEQVNQMIQQRLAQVQSHKAGRIEVCETSTDATLPGCSGGCQWCVDEITESDDGEQITMQADCSMVAVGAVTVPTGANATAATTTHDLSAS